MTRTCTSRLNKHGIALIVCLSIKSENEIVEQIDIAAVKSMAKEEMSTSTNEKSIGHFLIIELHAHVWTRLADQCQS